MAYERDILEEFADAAPPAAVPGRRGRAGHGRRGPGQRVLRRRRALDGRGRDAARPPQPAAPLRLEARRLPARRSPGDVAPPGGPPRGVGRSPARSPRRARWPPSGPAARVAAASRIWVEGRHDAELLELVWGDELRDGGIVVEPLHGADHLADAVAAFAPSAATTPRACCSIISCPVRRNVAWPIRCQRSVRARHRAPVRRRLGGHSAERHRPRRLAGRAAAGCRGRRGCAARSAPTSRRSGRACATASAPTPTSAPSSSAPSSSCSTSSLALS